MRVVLDTCIICRDFHMSKSTFRVFLDGLSRVGYSLHIPRIVYDEVLNKYAEELTNRKQRIEQAIRGLERFTVHEFIAPVSDADLQNLLNEYTDLLNAKFTAVRANYLDYPDVSHKQLVSRALKRRKPFSESGKGYRDTLIWESVLQLAAHSGMQPIAFISCNSKDFADERDQLHPDLLEDVASLGEQCCEIVFFNDLETFVDSHIKPTMEVLEDVRAQLEADQYPNFRLDVFIEEELVSHVGSTELDPLDIGLPPEFETPSLCSVQGIYGVGDIDVRQLSTGDLIITLSTSINGEFDFFLFKADYYTLPEEELPSIWDTDWNEHYMAGSVTAHVDLKLNLTFDTDSTVVTSADIVEVSPSAREYVPIAQQWRATQEALARSIQQWGAIQEALDTQLKAYQKAMAVPSEQWKAIQETLARPTEQWGAIQETLTRSTQQSKAIQEALDVQLKAYQKALAVPSEQWKAMQEALAQPAQQWKAIQDALDVQLKAYQKAMAIPLEQWKAIQEASKRLAVPLLSAIETPLIPKSSDTATAEAAPSEAEPEGDSEELEALDEESAASGE